MALAVFRVTVDTFFLVSGKAKQPRQSALRTRYPKHLFRQPKGDSLGHPPLVYSRAMQPPVE